MKPFQKQSIRDLDGEFEQAADLIGRLKKAGAKFIIIGGYAVMFYTQEPRNTPDLDLWIEPTRKNCKIVHDVLSDFGQTGQIVKVGSAGRNVTPIAEGIPTEDQLKNLSLIFHMGTPPRQISVLSTIGVETFRKAWPLSIEDNGVRFLGISTLIKNKSAIRMMNDKDRDDIRKLRAIKETRGKREYYLIVASYRSGSTLIGNSLPSYGGELWRMARIQEEGENIKEAFYQPVKRFNSHPGLGAKVMTDQLDKMRHVSLLFRQIKRAVFLRRKNLTEQTISYALAEKFGFNQIEKKEHPVRLNIRQLQSTADRWVKSYYRWWEYVRARCETMALWYEEINDHPEEKIEEVRSFLCLPNTKPHGLQVMRSPERYERIIVNYEEIVRKMGPVYGVPFGDPGTRWDRG
jgi:LPS sulfotransferase NodH